MPAFNPARYGLKPSRLCYAAALALLIVILGWPAFARSDAALCESATRHAARKHGVPLDVLRAVALLETGRTRAGRMRPWPWALNAGGQSHWLRNRTDARDTARRILATGRRNLDFGCFQLNYHWHGDQFASPADMLDPAQNADYAARYLLKHYRRLGDWTAAVGAYHSRTPEHAARYLARYDRIARQLEPAPAPRATASAPAHDNPALLAETGSGARGSVVPASFLKGAGPLVRLGDSAR